MKAKPMDQKNKRKKERKKEKKKERKEERKEGRKEGRSAAAVARRTPKGIAKRFEHNLKTEDTKAEQEVPFFGSNPNPARASQYYQAQSEASYSTSGHSTYATFLAPHARLKRPNLVNYFSQLLRWHRHCPRGDWYSPSNPIDGVCKGCFVP